MTEKEAYEEYDEMLNERFPLEEINCNPFSTLPFSILLAKRDPIAYDIGFTGYIASRYGKIEFE